MTLLKVAFPLKQYNVQSCDYLFDQTNHRWRTAGIEYLFRSLYTRRVL